MRIWLRLLLLAVYAVLVVAAFLAGFELGQARMAAILQPEVADSQERLHVTEKALADVGSQLTALKQEGVVLERSLQIERETARSLQAQLKEAQDERLSLIKESKYLKRLIRDGGQGAVRVHDLRLTRVDGADRYRYGFTVTQLVPGVGKSTGRVILRLEGKRDGEDVSVPLKDLPGAEPATLPMKFEFFQNFQGVFGLPEGLEPRVLSISIEPDGDDILRTSEAFPWIMAEPGIPVRQDDPEAEAGE
jgi:hypothetical protein